MAGDFDSDLTIYWEPSRQSDGASFVSTLTLEPRKVVARINTDFETQQRTFRVNKGLAIVNTDF